MPEKDPTTWTVLDCGSDAAWRRALSVLKWLMLLPLKLVAMLLAVLLAPLAAGVSMFRADNSLPEWLGWMLTRDNSIDALWQQEQHLDGYWWLRDLDEIAFQQDPLLRWLARMLWLIRNPAAGLSDTLGYESIGQPVRIWAQRGVWDSGETNWLIQTWPGAWQVKAQLFYRAGGTRFLRINLGWKSVSNRSRLIYTNHVNPFRSRR